MSPPSVPEVPVPTITTPTRGNGTVIDPTHPYFLHACDAPGMSRSILITLSAKNKLGFIDGSCPTPAPNSPDLKTWNRCNDMVTSWLLNSLTKNIVDSVLYSKTSKDLWTDLEHRFGQPDSAKLYHLQKELADSVQGSDDIAGYFTKLKYLWDELDTLNTNVHCSCNCNCGGKQKMIQFKDDERLIQFFMGLNETYTQARSNILMINPLPTVNHAYSLLMQHENQREVHSPSQFPGDGSLFMAGIQATFTQSNSQLKVDNNKGNPNYKGKKNNQMCSYCKMTNHTIQNCYRLVGFPSDFKFAKSKKFQGLIRSNAANTTDESETIQNNSIEGPQFAQKLSSN
ncbi:uncharacterized protein [Nicotiana sylvestris]|uniref:Uncharacterized protein LOC104243984 n=1 Tax=Nicotiana sylvestris TaxID=4096 RepID=A0A1U7YEA1_NICSY|nr:PREDICTED: uncharacterized protein LOC104243984 [Nicotiana sylvestris]